jgi:AraC-like DNA-binding protein
MAHAARMLMEGQTISETAAMIGYADEKSFSRAFLKVMKKPPSMYRKSHIMQP